jgi:hypothetical protein
MKQSYKGSLADSFCKLDVHDDALSGFRIQTPRSRKNLTRIDLEFLDDSTGSKKVLSFRTCANLRFVMDFDVLADNWHFGNTELCLARTDVKRLRQFVKAQMSHWRTVYMPPAPKNQPIRKKLMDIQSYALFRVEFFGGTLEVLAKGYKLSD